MSAAVALPDLSHLLARMSLERRLCEPWAFGLTTASPLQRAICRIADGRPLGDLAVSDVVLRALGGTPYASTQRPRELAILSGIRVGKSLLAAALAVHWTQTCDVSRLGPGEVPRVSVLSLTKDLANVVFSHVVGRVQQSPILSPLVVGQPGADSITLRHPTGRPVEICVVAGARAGASLVARWSAGCIFDEFSRMVGEADGVVNWDDSRKGVLMRLLPGAQMVHIGSPWAPFGPAYDLVQAYWRRPSQAMVVVKAPAFDMNPAYWTPEVVAKAKDADLDVFRTDVLAEFATPEEALYSSELLERAIKPACPREAGQIYTAAMDPATRGNSWTFGVFTRTGKRKRMVHAEQRTGSRTEPLSPRKMFEDVIAPACARYGVTSVDTDQYYVDALQDIAREFGLSLVQTPLTDRDKTERYLGIGAKLEEGEVEIVADAREDLQRLRKRVTQNGVQIVLPLTSDGRHCDFAPVIMLGLGRYLRDVEPEAPKRDPEAERMLKEAERRYGRRKSW